MSESFGAARETRGFLDLREWCGTKQHNTILSKDLNIFSLLLPSSMIDLLQIKSKHYFFLQLHRDIQNSTHFPMLVIIQTFPLTENK